MLTKLGEVPLDVGLGGIVRVALFHHLIHELCLGSVAEALEALF